MKIGDIKVGRMYWAGFGFGAVTAEVVAVSLDGTVVCDTGYGVRCKSPDEVYGPVYQPTNRLSKLWSKLTGTWDKMEPLSR